MRLGRVEMTGDFLLLLAWLNYLDRSFLVPMALAACAAHELGHIAAIRLLGGYVREMRLTAVGAELVLERPLAYWQEGMAALAGPGANLLLALAGCRFDLTFAGLNLALALFNLLPVGRLDGGRAVCCTLALLAGPGQADRVGRWLDCLCTASVSAAGLFLALWCGNITLLPAACWLLAVFLRQNIGNRTCQRCGKKVQ